MRSPTDLTFAASACSTSAAAAGRVLRQLAPWADSGEFWGCDTYEPTHRLAQREPLAARFASTSTTSVRLPHPDGYLDLVYAISVFTHITHEWAEWLLELRRILKPGGLLAATFIGPASWERSLHRQVDEDQLGVAMLRLDQSYAQTSGPLVLHSPWWLRSHWGRAYEVLTLVAPRDSRGQTRPGRGDRAEEAILRRLTRATSVFVGRKRDAVVNERPTFCGPTRMIHARKQQRGNRRQSLPTKPGLVSS